MLLQGSVHEAVVKQHNNSGGGDGFENLGCRGARTGGLEPCAAIALDHVHGAVSLLFWGGMSLHERQEIQFMPDYRNWIE